jgi:hypothetical protein
LGRDDPFAAATRDLREEVRADGGLQAGAQKQVAQRPTQGLVPG